MKNKLQWYERPITVEGLLFTFVYAILISGALYLLVFIFHVIQYSDNATVYDKAYQDGYDKAVYIKSLPTNLTEYCESLHTQPYRIDGQDFVILSTGYVENHGRPSQPNCIWRTK